VDVFIEESDPARSAALEMQIRSGPLSKQVGRYPVKAVTVSPLSAGPSSHSNLLGDLLSSSTDASAARQLGAVYFAECIVLVHKLADGAEVLWTTVVELQPTDAGVVSIANHLTRCLSRLGLPAPSARPPARPPAAARAREVLHCTAPSEVQSLRSKKGCCRRYGAGATTSRCSCPTRTATTRSNWRWRGTGANSRACSGLKPPSGPGTPGAASSPRDPTPTPMLAAGSRRIPVRSHACRALHGSVRSVTTPRSLTCTLRAAAGSRL
jgi:hypothetical protein